MSTLSADVKRSLEDLRRRKSSMTLESLVEHLERNFYPTMGEVVTEMEAMDAALDEITEGEADILQPDTAESITNALEAAAGFYNVLLQHLPPTFLAEHPQISMAYAATNQLISQVRETVKSITIEPGEDEGDDSDEDEEDDDDDAADE